MDQEWSQENGNLVRFSRRYDIDIKDGEHVAGEQNIYVEITNKGSGEVVGYRLGNARKLKEFAGKFPKTYQAFLDDQTLEVEGTPLSEMPGLVPELLNAWSLLGVRTIEDLAELSDAGVQRLGQGAFAFRKQAQEKLELEKLRAEAAMIERYKNDQKPSGNSAGRDERDRDSATKRASGGKRAGRKKVPGARKPGRPRTVKTELGNSTEGSHLHDDQRDN